MLVCGQRNCSSPRNPSMSAERGGSQPEIVGVRQVVAAGWGRLHCSCRAQCTDTPRQPPLSLLNWMCDTGPPLESSAATKMTRNEAFSILLTALSSICTDLLIEVKECSSLFYRSIFR
jgi:hypothetical protein